MVTVKNYSGNSFTLSAPFLHDCQSKASIVIRTPNGWDLHLLIKQRESPSICTVVNEMLSSPEQVIATIKQRLQEHGEPSEINHRELMQYMRLCEEVMRKSEHKNLGTVVAKRNHTLFATLGSLARNRKTL